MKRRTSTPRSPVRRRQGVDLAALRVRCHTGGSVSFTLLDGRHHLTGARLPNAIRMITLSREIPVADVLAGMGNVSAFNLLAGYVNEDGRYLQILDPDADVGDALRRVMPTEYVGWYQSAIATVLALEKGDRRMLHRILRESYRSTGVLVEPDLLLQEAMHLDKEHQAMARWITSGGTSAAPRSHSPSLHLTTHLRQHSAFERHDILAGCFEGRWIAMRLSGRRVIGEHVTCSVLPPRSFATPTAFRRWLSLALRVDRTRPCLGRPRTLLVTGHKPGDVRGAQTTLRHSGAYSCLARAPEPGDDGIDLQPYRDEQYLSRRVQSLRRSSTGNAGDDRQLLGRAAADPLRADPFLSRGVLYTASHWVVYGPERPIKAVRVLNDPEHEALLVRAMPAGLVHPGAPPNPARLRVGTRRTAYFLVPHSPFID